MASLVSAISIFGVITSDPNPASGSKMPEKIEINQ
jgi:hypothetical protein